MILAAVACAAWLLLFGGAQQTMAAMDAPHNAEINCVDCHVPHNSTWWTDQGATLGICGQCHYPGSPKKDAVTHRTTAEYGSLTVLCSGCHNPHYQRQLRSWSAAVPGSYLTTGVVSTVNATTLTVAGTPWTANQWAGMVLVPNTTYMQFNYMILSSTENSITVSGSINLAYAAAGNTFGVTYGGLIKESINARSVKFFRKTGDNSFADNDAVIDGVCQVCHTQTPVFNVSGALNGGTHVPDQAGADCTACHSHTNPNGGFLASCADCHGFPPTGATVVYPALGGPDGLAKYTDNSGTGSADTGKHLKHADSGAGNLGYPCLTCHTGYAMPQDAAKTIDIGFTIFGAEGGSFVGQQSVAYTGHAPTTASSGTGGAGDSTCSTVYCHSSAQGSDGVSAPTYASPKWLAAESPLGCSNCHASSPATGSHTPHLGVGGVTCGTCHTGNTHVNGGIEVTAGDYTSGGAPRNGFGTCSTASCHDNGRGVSAITPTWGTAVTDCSECHATQPATGNHTRHLTGLTGFNRNAVCADCHGDAVEGATPPTGVHLDGDVDVFNDSNTTPNTDLGYLANVAKHDDNNYQFRSCTTAYCHSNGMNGTVLNAYKSASWGGGSTGCGFCHNALPTTGVHAKHVKIAATSYGSTSVSTTGGSNDFGCGNCHPVDTANHMNGTLDITLNSGHGGTLKSRNSVSDDTSGYNRTKGSAVTCSAAYCHSKGNGVFVMSLDWYGTFSGDTCGHCHANQPDTGPHAAHAVGIHYDNIYTGTAGLAAMGNTPTGAHGNPATSTTISCNLCHNQTVNTANNDKNTVCAGCHGTSAPLKGNAAIAAGSDTHLNGSPDIAFAAIQVMSKAQVRSDITSVTELNNSWTRTGGYKAAGAYDLAKNALNTATMWTGATKTCSNIACHNGKPAAWTGTLGCNGCHTQVPQ